MKKYSFFIVILCLFPIKTKESIIGINKQKIEVNNEEFVLNFIKKHEQGFNYNPKIHKDGNDNKTIGYGHLIKENEKFTNLTKFQADSLLKEDFKKIKRQIKYYYPTLNKNQFLAIYHLTYCIGIGNVRKYFDNQIKSGQLDSNKLFNYCHIKGKKNKYYKIIEGLNINYLIKNCKNEK